MKKSLITVLAVAVLAVTQLSTVKASGLVNLFEGEQHAKRENPVTDDKFYMNVPLNQSFDLTNADKLTVELKFTSADEKEKDKSGNLTQNASGSKFVLSDGKTNVELTPTKNVQNLPAEELIELSFDLKGVDVSNVNEFNLEVSYGTEGKKLLPASGEIVVTQITASNATIVSPSPSPTPTPTQTPTPTSSSVVTSVTPTPAPTTKPSSPTELTPTATPSDNPKVGDSRGYGALGAAFAALFLSCGGLIVMYAKPGAKKK